MITSAKIRHNFASETLTPANRLIAAIFAIVNVPLSFFAIIFPIGWVVGGPGVVLLINYFRIWADRVSAKTAKAIWAATAAYNLALMIGFASLEDMYPVVFFQAFAMGAALIAYRDLYEKEHEPVYSHPVSEESDVERVSENFAKEYI
ncbi:MAG: hypothetical protein R3C61_23045 [Bacteroidia bacterium]